MHLMASPVLFIEKDTVDLGLIIDKNPVVTVVNIVNSGDAVLEISKIKSGCGCSKVDMPKRILAPGESSPLHIEIIIENPGHWSKGFTLCSNDPKRPEYPFMVAGESQPEISFYPKSILIEKGQLHQKISFKSYLDEPLKLEATVFPPMFEVKTYIHDSKSIDLHVTWKDGLKPGTSGFVMVQVHSKKNQDIMIPIRMKQE
jgi:hypothetical protein